MYEELSKYLGEVFRRLAVQKENRIEEGHLMPDQPDQVHMMIAIPPKFAVSQVIGYIKGKSAIHLARVYGETKRRYGNTSATRSRKMAAGSNESKACATYPMA